MKYKSSKLRKKHLTLMIIGGKTWNAGKIFVSRLGAKQNKLPGEKKKKVFFQQERKNQVQLENSRFNLETVDKRLWHLAMAHRLYNLWFLVSCWFFFFLPRTTTTPPIFFFIFNLIHSFKSDETFDRFQPFRLSPKLSWKNTLIYVRFVPPLGDLVSLL